MKIQMLGFLFAPFCDISSLLWPFCSLSIFQIVRPIPGERVGDFNTIICMRFYRSVVLALLLDLFLGSLHAA
jgi:hypothetical protein